MLVTTDVERQQIPNLEQVVIYRHLMPVEAGSDDMLPGFVARDEVLDLTRELARRPWWRLRDRAVAGLPKPGPVLADQKTGVAVDVREHVDRPLIGGKLRGVGGNLLKARTFSGGRIEIRVGLVAQPSSVVVLRGAHHRGVRPRPFERLVPPMRGEQPCELGMVVLRDHHDRAIRLIANDHAALLWFIELLTATV